MVSIKANGLDQFEVVPVDVALLDLLGSGLLLASALLLLEVVVVVGLPAALQGLLLAQGGILQPAYFALLHFQQVGVGRHGFDEVGVVFGGRAQELELGVVFLSFAQSDEEVSAVSGGVLSSVQDDSLLCL